MPVNIYTTFDDPLATTGNTQAYGINSTGQISGSYGNASGAHGFLYSGPNYTTLDDPLATNGTSAQGINAAGQVVGWYRNSSGIHGFLKIGVFFTTLDDPA